MRYMYSNSLGMQTIHFDEIPNGGIWSDTEEEAYLYFYIKRRNARIQDIESHKRSIALNEDNLKELDEKFGYLKEKYPEEFV